MPESTETQDVKRPSIYRLNFQCSTGYCPPPDKRDFHNKVKADAAIRAAIDGAKKRGATWGEGFLHELYKDKDSGQFKEQPNAVYAVYRFGKKP